MEELSKKRKRKFYPEFVTERSLTSGEKKYKNKKYQSSVINKKSNPLSFVVPWQLSDKQE